MLKVTANQNKTYFGNNGY